MEGDSVCVDSYVKWNDCLWPHWQCTGRVTDNDRWAIVTRNWPADWTSAVKPPQRGLSACFDCVSPGHSRGRTDSWLCLEGSWLTGRPEWPLNSRSLYTQTGACTLFVIQHPLLSVVLFVVNQLFRSWYYAHVNVYPHFPLPHTCIQTHTCYIHTSIHPIVISNL